MDNNNRYTEEMFRRLHAISPTPGQAISEAKWIFGGFGIVMVLVVLYILAG